MSALFSSLSFLTILVFYMFPKLLPNLLFLPFILATADTIFFLIANTMNLPTYPFPLPGILGIIVDLLSWFGLVFITPMLGSLISRLAFAIVFAFLLVLTRHYPIMFIWYPITFIMLFTSLVNKKTLSDK